MDSLEDYIGAARAAVANHDWPKALALWGQAAENFPQQSAGILGKGEALREMGRLDEAEAIFANAMERFPTNLWAAANHAIIAARLCDWGEALNRWEGIKETFPDHAVGYVGYGEALRDTGRFDEADAAFAEAEERFPSDVWAATNHAGLAARRQDW